MGSSYLLTGLAAYAKTMELPGFLSRYPHHWLVWEVGQWEPPRASTIQMDKETLRKLLAAADPQAMPLEEKPEIPGQPRQLTLGRGAQCELVVTDGTVSDRHLLFTKVTDGWNVRDMGSRNGSRWNGQPLPPGHAQRLRSGDTLHAGQVRLSFYSAEGMHARARAAAKR